MIYYNEIKQKLIDSEIYAKIKNYSKEKDKVITYFEIGRLLNETGKEYGEYNNRSIFKKSYRLMSEENIIVVLYLG